MIVACAITVADTINNSKIMNYHTVRVWQFSNHTTITDRQLVSTIFDITPGIVQEVHQIRKGMQDINCEFCKLKRCQYYRHSVWQEQTPQQHEFSMDQCMKSTAETYHTPLIERCLFPTEYKTWRLLHATEGSK